MAKKLSGITWRNNIPKPSQNLIDNILSSIFLNGNVCRAAVAPVADEGTSTEKYFAVAEINSEALTLTIQKKAGQITEKLGYITLHPDELEISLFDWCDIAIQSREKTLNELDNLKSVIAKRDEEIKRLKGTLEKMTQLKRVHESELLEKFALLLNEKKARIRVQCREQKPNFIFDDPDPESDFDRQKVASLRDNTKHLSFEKGGLLRRSKRKATQAYSESETEAGSEKNDELVKATFNDSDRGSKITPEASETETDEDTTSLLVTKKSESELQIGQGRKSSFASLTEEVILPPRRKLPFTKKEISAALSKEAEPALNSETDSDDEL